MKGTFIVFEGVDRSGKTTQSKRCAQRLREMGASVVDGAPWRFPDRTTPVGKLIDAYLKEKSNLDDHALHLLFSANRWEKAAMITSALDRGEVVIVDRYTYSGVAYSSAKGLDFDWCLAPDKGLPVPNLVVFLDLPFEVASKRGDFGGERYEKKDLQLAVREQYKALRDDSWKIIDADATEDIVLQRVMEAVCQQLKLES